MANKDLGDHSSVNVDSSVPLRDIDPGDGDIRLLLLLLWISWLAGWLRWLAELVGWPELAGLAGWLS